jgi:hypothetical protein
VSSSGRKQLTPRKSRKVRVDGATANGREATSGTKTWKNWKALAPRNQIGKAAIRFAIGR